MTAHFERYVGPWKDTARWQSGRLEVTYSVDRNPTVRDIYCEVDLVMDWLGFELTAIEEEDRTHEESLALIRWASARQQRELQEINQGLDRMTGMGGLYQDRLNSNAALGNIAARGLNVFGGKTLLEQQAYNEDRAQRNLAEQLAGIRHTPTRQFSRSNAWKVFGL